MEALRAGKNLLGFSAQVDSTALFYVLMARGIDFDVAIVDYGVRKDSKDEVRLAKKLARRHNKRVFIAKAPHFASNFEANARTFRYEFFAEILQNGGYENLILAHQLNDRLEWFLMQLSRGAGLNSLLGFDEVADFMGFRIIRPFYKTPRAHITRFLKRNKIKHFKDKSNEDSRYTRNYFRKHFANKLMREFSGGISNSFDFLRRDFAALYGKSDFMTLQSGAIVVFRAGSVLKNLHNIDMSAKHFGYVVSRRQRDEILKSAYSCEIAGKIIIDTNGDFIFVARKGEVLKHTKGEREAMRKARIPPKIRPLAHLDIIDEIQTLRKESDEISGF